MAQELAEYSAAWWINEINVTSKELDEKWRTSADKVVEAYLDDRKSDGVVGGPDNKYNVFWANIRILKSALYATPPKPTVTRDWGDNKDDAARVASLMLERILQRGFTKDRSDMHSGIKQCVEDRLIPGLGQIWFRYEVETEPVSHPAVMSQDGTTVLVPAVTGERIVSEKVCTDYVYWRDFLWQLSRSWEEVGWVARRVWMRKKKFLKRFPGKGEELWKKIRAVSNESTTANDPLLPKGFKKGKVEVWEVWCEDTNKVYFLNRHLEDEMLDEKEDLLKLDNFFPCPPPLLATHTTNSLIPRPDYTMCQDQYRELNMLNDRIYTLTKALRVVGVYDKESSEVGKMLSGGELAMVPADNWAMLAEKGGLKGVVDWFPVEQVGNVLKELVQQRILVIQQIYELTSISDIMRGASNPRETLGAQKLKSQYSSVSLQLTQQDVASFVRDAMLIKSQIISNLFQPESIVEQSAIEQTESGSDLGLVARAIGLLKDWKEGMYRIDISEESLSIADYTAEREMRTELLTSVGQFLSQSAAMIEAKPELAPALLTMIKWSVASFRGSADIETVLDTAIAKVLSTPPAPPEGAPDQTPVAMAKVQSENIKAQQKTQDTQVQAQAQLQMNADKLASQERIAQGNNQTAIIVEEMKQQGNQLSDALQSEEGAAERAFQSEESAASRAFDEEQSQRTLDFQGDQSSQDRTLQQTLARQQSKKKD